MKVAVCFFGLCRGQVKRNIESHQHHFPFDFFYGTWDERVADLDQLPESSFITTPEPVMHYHPIIDNTFKLIGIAIKLHKFTNSGLCSEL